MKRLICLILGHRIKYSHLEHSWDCNFNSIYNCDRCGKEFKNYYLNRNV